MCQLLTSSFDKSNTERYDDNILQREVMYLLERLLRNCFAPWGVKLANKMPFIGLIVATHLL